MKAEQKSARNWFDRDGRSYASFRPVYPASLSQFLAESAPDMQGAVDVGCGTGQLTHQLADFFQSVIGVDPSAEQIGNALPHKRVEYVCAPAEKLPLPDRSVSLITAAQSAHWFDLAAFYDEARRVAVSGAVIALVSYGVPRLAPADLDARFRRFYWEEIACYWPPERKLVESGYADLEFPFEERPTPQMEIDRAWDESDFLSYLSTWSAVRQINEAGRDDILEAFVRDLHLIWGDPEKKRPVLWPINMRVGII